MTKKVADSPRSVAFLLALVIGSSRKSIPVTLWPRPAKKRAFSPVPQPASRIDPGDLVGHVEKRLLRPADVPGRLAGVDVLEGVAVGYGGHAAGLDSRGPKNSTARSAEVIGAVGRCSEGPTGIRAGPWIGRRLSGFLGEQPFPGLGPPKAVSAEIPFAYGFRRSLCSEVSMARLRGLKPSRFTSATVLNVPLATAPCQVAGDVGSMWRPNEAVVCTRRSTSWRRRRPRRTTRTSGW